MPHPIQRSACDRCHGQKLRCARPGSGGACVRCIKARAVCTWSPLLRCRRASRPEVLNTPNGRESSIDEENRSPPIATPADALFQVAQPVPDLGLSPDMFQYDSTIWPVPTFADPVSDASSTLVTSTGSPTSISQLESQNTLNTWQDRFNREWAMLSIEQQSPQKSDSSPGEPISAEEKSQLTHSLPLAVVRGLSDLNVELFTLSSSIPKPPTSTSQPLSWKNKDFAIDKTFQLSQKLIEVLDKLYPRYRTTARDCSTLQYTKEPEFLNQSISFDHASLLLVLSCYQRLIEAYNDIFGNMQACLDRSATTMPEDYVQMPNMKVGSFSLPNSSALQITLVLQLARHLLQRMGVIIKALDQSRGAVSDDMNDLISLTFKTVNTREIDLIGRINKLRNTLVSLDIL